MKKIPDCLSCTEEHCRAGIDCFNISQKSQDTYKENNLESLFKAGSNIEATHYCKEPRIREIMFFAKEINAKKLGIAYCVGVEEEARFLYNYLKKSFDVYSVRCKAGGIDKKIYSLKQIRSMEQLEVMCNPAGQAMLLNKAQTDLNIVVGLCVGHDSVFYKLSEAPVTTFMTKDRVLAHNPAAAVYCQYIHKTYELK